MCAAKINHTIRLNPIMILPSVSTFNGSESSWGWARLDHFYIETRFYDKNGWNKNLSAFLPSRQHPCEPVNAHSCCQPRYCAAQLHAGRNRTRSSRRQYGLLNTKGIVMMKICFLPCKLIRNSRSFVRYSYSDVRWLSTKEWQESVHHTMHHQLI